MANEQDLMEKIVSLAKRRGFIFPSSEIYGGINGFWDYGPLGVELKRNIKEAWWQDNVRCPDIGPDGRMIQMVGLDCSIIMNPKVWEASGHVVNFNDPLVDCKQCKARFRADKVFVVCFYDVAAGKALPAGDVQAHAEFMCNPAYRFGVEVDDESKAQAAAIAGANSDTRRKLESGKYEAGLVKRVDKLTPSDVPPACPACGGLLTDARKFNMMFKTHCGAMEDSASEAYLRPETAQGIFVNYPNVLDTARVKVPFGIAQVGKSFRNEINPRNFTFRSREFEQMEIEFFCHPTEADKWYEYWRDARYKWYVAHGLKSSKLHLRNHEKDELAHYARACADIEYEFPFGTAELEGVANRTDFDLTQHQKFSGRDLTYFNEETKERYIPYVIEPSGGVDRACLAFLCEAYAEDQAPDEKGAMQTRTVLRFHPRLAPIKVAVFPLVRKDGMPEKAQAIYRECARHFAAFYDEKGAVGRRYRRQDEAGTPFCVTVDGQTTTDGTVTVRDRDTLQQVRIPAEGVAQYVRDRLRL